MSIDDLTTAELRAELAALKATRTFRWTRRPRELYAGLRQRRSPRRVNPRASRALYEAPRHVTRLEDCFIYHSMYLPGIGEVEGEWDLRLRVNEYLGKVPLAGRRVLEIGPASGFLTFHMETAGAEVVSVELPIEQPWDLLPAWDIDVEKDTEARREGLVQLSNGYWLAHEANRSKARVYRGSAYELPDALGSFDLALLGCVLLHMRDPAQALCECARVTTGSIVVTDPLWSRDVPGRPVLELLPASENDRRTTWWQLTPEFVVTLLDVLGFRRSEVTFHEQLYVATNQMVPMFTVVASR